MGDDTDRLPQLRKEESDIEDTEELSVITNKFEKLVVLDEDEDDPASIRTTTASNSKPRPFWNAKHAYALLQ